MDYGALVHTVTGNITLSGGTANLNTAQFVAAGTQAFNGNGATIANTDAVIFANGQTVTVSNVDYATTSAPIICVSCVAGTGNGAGVSFQEPARMLTGIGF